MFHRIQCSLRELPTPSLCVDMKNIDHNKVALERLLVTLKAKARPCVKSHKCPWIAQNTQLNSKAVRGICCATVGEVETMIRHAGARDVLLANIIASDIKIRRVVDVCSEFGPAHGDCTKAEGENALRMILCTDNRDVCTKISAFAKERNITLGCLVEINVGQNRCGVATPEDAVALALHINSLENLKFLGIQGYHGACQHVRLRQDRAAISKSVAEILDKTDQLLRDEGLVPEIITGGGTGSFVIDAQIGKMTEVQPGSYLFMDVDYGLNEEKFNLFKPSLFILGTVISKSHDRFIIDAGIKSHSVDSGLPSFFDPVPATWKLRNGGDEHFAVDNIDESAPNVGDIIRLIPGHVDPTFNMHDKLYLVRGDQVEGYADIYRGPL